MTPDLRSYNLAEEKRQELLRLFPEARTEGGKLDFERLQLALGEAVDVGKKRYGMSWPGKADCFKTIQMPSLGRLLPCREESVEFDTTENLTIEADNLEVLKLLQKSYLSKVKMLYINPPYNTDNDLIYPDDYSESLQTYLEQTGPVGAAGNKFSTNTEADGRFHSKWLNMTYPRLYLASNLRREDGVIFISLDDNEVDNLRKLCNEIYGEETTIGANVRRRRQVSDNRNLTNFSPDHEYVLAVARSSGVLLGEARELLKYSNPDNDSRGPWMSDDLTGLVNAQERPNLYYVMVHPILRVKYPPLPSRGWCFEASRMHQMISANRILRASQPDGHPRLKRFLNEVRSQFTDFSSVQDRASLLMVLVSRRSCLTRKSWGFPNPKGSFHRGFHVFKLAESNFKPRDPDVPSNDVAALAQQLELHINHKREDCTADDLLYEILLKIGFPLTTPVE